MSKTKSRINESKIWRRMPELLFKQNQPAREEGAEVKAPLR